MLYCAVTFVLDVYLCKGASQYYLSFYESTDQYMHFVMNLKLFWWMLRGVYKIYTDNNTALYSAHDQNWIYGK